MSHLLVESREGAVIVFELEGTMDHLATEELTCLIQGKNNNAFIVFDCSSTIWGGEDLIAVFASLWKKMQKGPGRFVLCCVPPVVQEKLEVAHLDKLIVTFATRTQAVADLTQ